MDNSATWHCEYCGRNNASILDHCWDGVNGCGASKPVGETPAREAPTRSANDDLAMIWDMGSTQLMFDAEGEVHQLQTQLGRVFLPAMMKVVGCLCSMAGNGAGAA